ncbi:MAG: hypothetical protein JJU29_19800 [Verrucomicrobia bacterium]|nr:hypothetical protein [Verrucomicrobiota bacterium]MCH8513498.1 hypothetical protein [Kiritimatiellia bacterium]
MSERLTSSSTSKHPRWLQWLPPLFLLVSAVALFSTTGPSREIPAELPDSLFHRLVQLAAQGLGTERAYWVFLPFALLLIWCSGDLTRRMLPPKTPAPARTLATSLGMVCATMLLLSWLQRGLSPQPASHFGMAATACLLAGWSLYLHGESAGKRHWCGFAGLMLGLGAGVNAFAAIGVLPVFARATFNLIKNAKDNKIRVGLLLLGFLLGFLPQLAAFRQSLPEATAFDFAHTTEALRWLFAAAGVAGVLFISLALLVGILQRNALMLGFVLSTLVLQKIATAFYAEADPERTGTKLALVAILYAYGLFRVVRGIESGLHSANPAKVKALMPALLILLLIIFKIWTARLFYPAG